MSESSLHASSSQEAIDLEAQYGANNYASLPIVFAKGKGTKVWDPEGKEYLDFLSGICAVAQGHCHPKIVAAMTEQASRLTLPSRAFYSDNFGKFAKFATEYFGYDKILMMNTGVEANETAIKLARKWGYRKKEIPAGSAKIVVCDGNFHGRTIAAISAASGDDAARDFGPVLSGFVRIPYNDLPALETALADPHVVAFLVEPVQGEGGVVVPKEGYLKSAHNLCKKNNVLLIADEVQTGIGRTGKLLASHYEEVTPDILVLGKSLSAGMFPISAILANEPVMSVYQPGDHGSTFGGNPLACAVAMASLNVIRDENLIENAARMGELFRSRLTGLKAPVVEVRGKGLLNAIIFEQGKGPLAKDLCMIMIGKGLIAKNSRDHIVRFAPPLTISESEMVKATEIIKASLSELKV